jgi:hypothetical protein
VTIAIEGVWNGRTHTHRVIDETGDLTSPANREFCAHCDRKPLPVAIVIPRGRR